MGKKQVIAALDIGSSEVCVQVAEITRKKEIRVLGIGTAPSTGVKKGIIVDIDDTVEAIQLCVDKAEQMSGMKIDEVFVGLMSKDLLLLRNRGVVAVSSDDREITVGDVERVVGAAGVIAVPPDKEIVGIIPREYIIDGYDGIRHPIGMVGTRLEVDALVIAAPTVSVQNLRRCVERAGLSVAELVLVPLALAEAVLSEDEEELGVALLDIGGGTTDICVFQQGLLVDVTSIPIGSGHITSDLAVGLKTTLAIAEDLKIREGSAVFTEEDENTIMEVQTIGGGTGTVSKEELVRIIAPRVEEILYLVKEKMYDLGYRVPLPAGYVITGGAVLLPGFAELAERELDAAVRLARPQMVGVDSPVYTSVVGILKYVAAGISGVEQRDRRSSGGLFQKLQSFFREFWE